MNVSFRSPAALEVETNLRAALEDGLSDAMGAIEQRVAQDIESKLAHALRRAETETYIALLEAKVRRYRRMAASLGCLLACGAAAALLVAFWSTVAIEVLLGVCTVGPMIAAVYKGVEWALARMESPRPLSR